MVNLPRGREVSGLHGVRSLFQGAILRLVRLNGLSVMGTAAAVALLRFKVGVIPVIATSALAGLALRLAGWV